VSEVFDGLPWKDPVLPRADYLLTRPEAAQWLGTSERHLERLTSERRIPFVRVGGKIRYLRADITAWLQANRVEPES
jgi:excisionase family DNA binding protein